MSQDIEELRFLCQVVQDLQNNNYKVIVNTEDMLDIPTEKHQSHRIVVSRSPLTIGSKILCKARLDSKSRQMKINDYLLVTEEVSKGQEVAVEPELVQLIESLDTTPKDLMDTIFQEDLEDDEEDDSELQDSKEEDGDN